MERWSLPRLLGSKNVNDLASVEDVVDAGGGIGRDLSGGGRLAVVAGAEGGGHGWAAVGGDTAVDGAAGSGGHWATGGEGRPEEGGDGEELHLDVEEVVWLGWVGRVKSLS